MARPIKYLYLNKSELQYEVTIRAEKPTDNVSSLREQITKLSHISPERITSSPIPLNDDLAQIGDTLGYIEEKIISIESTGDRSNLKKIETFINHVYYRLERLKVLPLLIEECSNVRSRFYILEKRFETLTLDSVTEDILVDIHEPSITQTPAHQALQISQDLPTPHVASISHDIPSNSQTIPISEAYPLFKDLSASHNLAKELKTFSFNGKTCPRSFLQKLEEFRISRNISEEKLCRHAFEIFVGDALHWFRFQYNRNSTLTWRDIHNLLIKDFGTHDYDYKLLEAIRNRTQGASETIIVYVSIMFGMFSRLSKKLNESEQLEILLHNVRPCYSVFIALKDVKTIDSLISTCQTYEHFSERDRDFHEPNREEKSRRRFG